LLTYPNTYAPAHPPPLRPDAAYLVTGGLGALGLGVARWLVERGARHVVLIGRRPPSPATEDALASLRRSGATVTVAGADVTETEDLQRVLAEAAATLPPLRGVVHAAGRFGHCALGNLTDAALRDVLRPKLVGAWLLHCLTAGLKLDFFVCFSSAAALWGSKGQAHYAAANGFLDGLAAYRQHRGLPALSLAWGPWEGAGMATAEARAQLARIGVRALDPAAALAAMERHLGGGEARVAIADVDWPRLREVYGVGRARTLLDDLVPAAFPDPHPAAAAAPLQADYIRLSPDERRDWLVAHLQRVVAEVLGLGDPARADPRTGFFRLGMDSLMALDLKDRLAADFGTPLPSTLAFDHPTITVLAAHLAATVLGWEEPAELEPPPSIARRPPAAAAAPAGTLASKLARLESLVHEISGEPP
jgi:NAD(P)-dependent dehydrogenase (short-subunit alcohol dehydrogenase family)/acyl carrier protein